MGIGAKTLLSHIALALFAVVLTSVLSYVLTYHYVRDDLINNLADKAERIAEGVRNHSAEEGDEKRPSRRIVKIY